MKHLHPFAPRRVVQLPIGEANGWRLKRYAIVANDRDYDASVAESALAAAVEQLPAAGQINSPDDNHGVGFQIVHFAQVAIVSPVFYWMWGSVLANTDQMRAPLTDANNFGMGVKQVVGCVWEMEVVCFETRSWKQIMLGTQDPSVGIARYLEACIPTVD